MAPRAKRPHTTPPAPPAPRATRRSTRQTSATQDAPTQPSSSVPLAVAPSPTRRTSSVKTTPSTGASLDFVAASSAEAETTEDKRTSHSASSVSQREKSPSPRPTTPAHDLIDNPYDAFDATVNGIRPHLPPATEAKKKKGPTENRSPFLQFFVVCPSDPTKLDCILCGHTSSYIFNSKKVSSNPKHHIATSHPVQYGVVTSQESRHVAAKQWLLRAIATGSLAFNIAQNVEIREFLKCLDPSFTLPDRKTLSVSILDSEYVVARRAVCDAVRGENIAITTDHWTSKDSNQSVMGSTAHLITPEWKRELFVLTLDEIEGSHNSDQVSAFLSEVKKEFELGSIYCCLSDSASVMVAGTAKGGVDRVGCVLHATHLFIMESIDSWQPALDIVNAIRKIAAHVHRSRKSWLSLLSALTEVNASNKKKIPMEIRIRWGSLLRMLRVAADQIDQLSDLAEDQGFPILDDG